MKSSLHNKYKESLISYYVYLFEYLLNNRSIQILSLTDRVDKLTNKIIDDFGDELQTRLKAQIPEINQIYKQSLVSINTVKPDRPLIIVIDTIKYGRTLNKTLKALERKFGQDKTWIDNLIIYDYVQKSVGTTLLIGRFLNKNKFIHNKVGFVTYEEIDEVIRQYIYGTRMQQLQSDEMQLIFNQEQRGNELRHASWIVPESMMTMHTDKNIRITRQNKLISGGYIIETDSETIATEALLREAVLKYVKYLRMLKYIEQKHPSDNIAVKQETTYVLKYMNVQDIEIAQILSLIDNLYSCGQTFNRWSTLLDSEILVQDIERAEAENIFKQYRSFYGE